jgi:hypothetical protein
MDFGCSVSMAFVDCGVAPAFFGDMCRASAASCASLLEIVVSLQTVPACLIDTTDTLIIMASCPSLQKP